MPRTVAHPCKATKTKRIAQSSNVSVLIFPPA
jgi:hypothetical protein